MGDHAVSCHGRGDMITRHYRIRDKIISACSGAHLTPMCKQKSLLPTKTPDRATISYMYGKPANQQHWTLASLFPCSQVLL